MIKKKVILFLFAVSLVLSGYAKPDTYVIDAQKNAIIHNSLGLNAVSEHLYDVAIQEFCIAISLNPRTQATSVYYNNLGETYMKVSRYRAAQGCFELAIKQYGLNFLYYQNLVNSYKAQKIVKTKIKYYQNKNDSNNLNMIMLGLLYIANGEVQRGIIKLDEYCMAEPDLILTGAVRSYLSNITQNLR